jgi:hypothetical protein
LPGIDRTVTTGRHRLNMYDHVRGTRNQHAILVKKLHGKLVRQNGLGEYY